MQEFKPRLNEILYEQESKRDFYKKELGTCPQGTLRCFQDHNRIQFFQITEENGQKKRRGINRDEETLRGLARKAFLQAALDLLDHNIGSLRNTMAELQEFEVEALLNLLRTRFPGLPEEFFIDPRKASSENIGAGDLSRRLESHREWASQSYEKSSFRPENLRITTSLGLKVRTKSEALIVELLYEYGIPFRYEQVLRINSSIIVPDFTFETASGAELYWEHAGMLTDPKYSFRHHLKMMQYESCGIYPWRDLIVTYDIDNEVNVKMIRNVIQDLLLPRL